jgi:hypothetical protein
MGRDLSIEEYDSLEAVARIKASYPAIRSFAPVSFGQVNFPTRVTEESELRRYVDIMYETADQTLWLVEEKWSEQERALILKLREHIKNLTASIFENAVDPFMNLFLPIPIMRMVEFISQEAGGKKLKVLEIGPGSGCLSAYLLLQGHNCIVVDNTQALYLWQNRLLRSLAAGDLRDFALEDAAPVENPTARVAMIPWWHFADMFRNPSLEVDVVICDAAIGEMDPFAARYIIRLAKSFLEKSEIGVFLYQNLGEQRHNKAATVNHLFCDVNGYRQFSCGSVTINCANDAIPDAVFMGLVDGPPHIGEGHGNPFVNGETFFDPNSPDILESYDFFDYLRLHLG